MDIRLLRTFDEKVVVRESFTALEIPHFNPDSLDYRSFLVALQGDRIVGMVCFVESSMRISGAIGLSFLSVHPDSRNQGVATRLAEALFELAEREGKAIANTRYEPDGERWLKPLFARISAKTPSVPLHEWM